MWLGGGEGPVGGIVLLQCLWIAGVGMPHCHDRVVCCRQKGYSSGFSAVVCGIGFVDSLLEWVLGIGMGKCGGS